MSRLKTSIENCWPRDRMKDRCSVTSPSIVCYTGRMATTDSEVDGQLRCTRPVGDHAVDSTVTLRRSITAKIRRSEAGSGTQAVGDEDPPSSFLSACVVQ